jgi:predicted DCC family thiol-disulfide oxidoreductase YuxK
MTASTDRPIWLFDGICVLCSNAVAFTLKHERTPEIRFVAIQSEEGRALARNHGIDPDDPESFLFIEDGMALAKSDGVIALARHFRRPFSGLAVLRILPRPIRDWLYDRLARNRYRIFGKKERCLVPTPETRLRFVLPE